MAIVSKLMRGSTTLNLNSTTTGFALSGRGWFPAVARPLYQREPGPLWETLHLLLAGSNHDDLASKMQDLHQMQVWAEQYVSDYTAPADPVWLHAKLANETGERRALVYAIETDYGASWYGAEATANDVPLTVRILRAPYWEDITARSMPDSGMGAQSPCIVYDYTAAGAGIGAYNPAGDVGARLRLLDIDEGGQNSINWYMMGIRSAGKRGSTGLTNFKHIWELEDGTNANADVTDQASTFASGGNYVRIQGSAVDWDKATNGGVFVKALTIRLSDVTANYEDNYGNYLWLLRADGAASTTWEVKLRFMDNNNNHYFDTAPIEIPSSIWIPFIMGTFPIPIRDHHAILTGDVSAAHDQQFGIEIHCRRTSGTGNLNLDCLMPIPIDEGFCFANGDDGNHTQHLYFGRTPEGRLKASYESLSSSYFDGFFPVKSDTYFYLPPGDGRIYCAYWSQNGDINDQIRFNDGDTGKYYERWLSLAGSE